MASATVLVDKATSDLLMGPDWGMNLEICDLINRDPGQAKDVIRAVKKRIGSKNPKVQLLALTVLETLVKNCGIIVHQQVAEKDVLHEMVKIVKRKTDMNVRDKILVLLDAWQEAFGGSRGRFPQFYMAYDELRRMGVDFPERAPENAAPIFTPPVTAYPVTAHPATGYVVRGPAPPSLDAPVHSDVPTMSLTEIEVARGALEVLSEMLNALNAGDRQALKDELIVELVSQSRSTQKRVQNLISVTSDEELLFQGLSLNDDFQRVLAKHDAIASGSPLLLEPSIRVTQNQSVQFEEEKETEDDFSQLAHRSAKSRISSKNEGKLSHNEQPSHSNGQLALPLPPQPIKKLSPPQGRRESVVDLLSTLDTHKDRSPHSPLTPPPWVDPNVGNIVSYESFSQEESSNPFASSPPFKATPSQPLQTFPAQQAYQDHYGQTNGHSSNPLPSFSQQQNSSSTFMPSSEPVQSGHMASWSMEGRHPLVPHQNIPLYSSDVQNPSPSPQSSYSTSTWRGDSRPLTLEPKAATPNSGSGHVAPHLPPPPLLHSQRQQFFQQQQARPEQQNPQYSGSARSDLVGQVHTPFDQNGSYYGRLNRKTDQQLALAQSSRKPSSTSSFTNSNKLFDDLVDLRNLTDKFKSADISTTLNKPNTSRTESL